MVQLFHPCLTTGRIIASLEGPWHIDGETMETVTDIIYFGGGEGYKITVDMTAAMKLKDNCSLEENI